MGDSTIAQLPAAITLTASDLIPVDQGGVTKRATLSMIGNGSVFISSGKSLTVTSTLTFTGTDGTTITFPATSATMARTDAGQTFTGTQVFNAISSTTFNGGGLSFTAGKTLTVNSTITFTGTDGTTITLPSTSATMARTDAAQTFTGSQTFSSTIIGSISGSAATLATPRTIDGVSFDGSANILVIAPATHAATNKATPVDADEFGIWDSVSGLLNHVTWSNIKATAKTYFDTIYAALAGSASQTFSVGTAASPAHAVRLDQMPQFPFRNRLINGDILVSQVNGTTAVTPTVTDTYPFDQWKVDATQASKLTFQQVADAPAGFKYSVKVLVASQFSPGAADRFGIYQPVEGQNIIDMQFGAATAQTIALSLWIKGSVAGTYACGVNNAGTRSYVGTISVTTSWVRQTVVLVADTTGTWATDNTIGAQFYIDLGSGSNFNTTAGAWQAGDFTRTTGTVTFVNQVNGSTLNFTGAQFEVIPATATVATPFETLPYGTQLARCQRYLPVWLGTGPASIAGICVTTTTGTASLAMPVETRVALTGAANLNGSISATDDIAFTLALSSLTFNSASQNVLILSWAIGVASATIGRPARLVFTAASNRIYGTGAQL